MRKSQTDQACASALQKWTRRHLCLSPDNGLHRTPKCEGARVRNAPAPRFFAVEKADTLHVPSDQGCYASSASSGGDSDERDKSHE
jgi:hypothetical protein